MPITFGSVGDIISVSCVIKDLVKCLDKSRGSSAQYQAVIRELWSLDLALLEVELLLRSCKQSVELSGLCETANRCAAQCRKCISDFRDKTRRYQATLQGGGTGNLLKDTVAKIRWHVKRDDLANFRSLITAHCSSLHMLLVTAGVKLTMLNHEGMHKRLKQSDPANASSSATQTSLLMDMSTSLEETNSLIQAAASETKVPGSRIDMNLGAELLSSVHRIWRINSMTYDAIVSLQARIPAQMGRDDLVMFEDALGRPTPFHLGFIDCWEAFESVLEIRFQNFPGHRKVKQKQYALWAISTNKDIDSSIAFNRCFLPGQHYDMSIIFDAARAQNSCPACSLPTGEASDARVKCNGCGLSYQRITETAADVAPVVQKTAVPSKSASLMRRSEEEPESDDKPGQFRRVRIRCRQRARNKNSQGEAEFETLEPRRETIRCVCGARDDFTQVWSAFNYPFVAAVAALQEAWVIRCIDCKVWQHRSCVGAGNGSDPPGGFYCERCSMEFAVQGTPHIHTIHTIRSRSSRHADASPIFDARNQILVGTI